jgi:hypothetical protein
MEELPSHFRLDCSLFWGDPATTLVGWVLTPG